MVTKHFYQNQPATRTARENGITSRAFYKRIKAGWTTHEAVTTPMHGRIKPKKPGIRDLIAGTGATYRQYDYWCTQGVFGPDPSKGSGHPRPPIDLTELAAAARAFNAGLRTATVTRIVELARQGTMIAKVVDGTATRWDGTIDTNHATIIIPLGHADV